VYARVQLCVEAAALCAVHNQLLLYVIAAVATPFLLGIVYLHLAAAQCRHIAGAEVAIMAWGGLHTFCFNSHAGSCSSYVRPNSTLPGSAGPCAGLRAAVLLLGLHLGADVMMVMFGSIASGWMVGCYGQPCAWFCGLVCL
jgi:hypothetical protein